ncbi:TPA: major capsid protein [Pseudomonas aeruginosa]
MAFDLAVFNKQTYTALTETVAQAIDKFNQASAGTIVLQNAPAQGDFDIKASFKLIANLVRRRNVYGNGDVAATRLTQLLNAAVKVAAGTPPIEYEAAQYNWVLQNPALAALTIGEQLGKARVADMLNTAIRGAVAAISGHADSTYGSATETATFRTLNKAAFKFGDRANAIAAWVFHSSVVSDLYDNALANAENLFTYDGVNVMRDPFGRLFVVTDADSLIVPAGADPEANPASFRSLGLVQSSVLVTGNNDFDAVLNRTTGKENLGSVYQAEWSYNLGVLGYTWKTGTGGASPNDTAIGTAANWERTATSVKDTAGVLVLSK